MFEKDYLFVAIVLLLLCAIVVTPTFAVSGPGQSVNAVITVTCAFGLSSNTLYSVYLQPNNAVLGYTFNTFGACTAAFMTGNLIIKNSTGSIVYTANLLYTNAGGGTTFSNIINVNSISLGHGSFNAYTTFENNVVAAPTTNTSSVSFQVLRPANVILTSLSVTPTSPPINSQLTVVGNLTNDGDLSAGNVVVNMKFTSPTSIVQTMHQSITSISPTSSSVFQISLSNVSYVTGAWNVVANVTYNSILNNNGNIFGSNYLISNTRNTTYNVTPAPSGGSSAPPSQQLIPPTNIGALSFSDLPLFLGMLKGSSISTFIGLTNNATKPLWVNFSTPKFTAVGFALSANSIYMLPKSTQLISLAASSNSTTKTGTYTLPINITATLVNSTPVKSRFFMTLRVVNSTEKDSLTQQISLMNYSKQASVSVLVRNPANLTLFNSTLRVQLPLFIANSASQIIPSGAVANVTVLNNAYLITYTIPELDPGQSTNVYYTIKNVVGPEYLSATTATFQAQTNILNNTIKVIDTKVPTFYINQTGTINITAIYVGSAVGNASFSLGGPSSVKVANPYLQYHVFPNQVLNPSFTVEGISEPGTYLLTLYTAAPGTNQSYSIPIVALQRSGTGPIIIGPQTNLTQYLYPALVIVFLAGLALGVNNLRKPAVHRRRKEQTEKLVMLKEQINREKE